MEPERAGDQGYDIERDQTANVSSESDLEDCAISNAGIVFEARRSATLIS